MWPIVRPRCSKAATWVVGVECVIYGGGRQAWSNWLTTKERICIYITWYLTSYATVVFVRILMYTFLSIRPCFHDGRPIFNIKSKNILGPTWRAASYIIFCHRLNKAWTHWLFSLSNLLNESLSINLSMYALKSLAKKKNLLSDCHYGSLSINLVHAHEGSTFYNISANTRMFVHIT